MYLYRYVDSYGYDANIVEQKYKIVKETPKGFWLKLHCYNIDGVDIFSANKKWIKKHTMPHKRFAFEDKRDAMTQYRHRKAAQVRILLSRLRHAERHYQQAILKDEYYRPMDEEKHSRYMYHQNKDYLYNLEHCEHSKEFGFEGFLKEEEMMI